MKYIQPLLMADLASAGNPASGFKHFYISSDGVPHTRNSAGTVKNLLPDALTSAYIFVGNGSTIATGVAVSGAFTLSNSGVATIATSLALPGSPTTTTQS